MRYNMRKCLHSAWLPGSPSSPVRWGGTVSKPSYWLHSHSYAYIWTRLILLYLPWTTRSLTFLLEFMLKITWITFSLKPVWFHSRLKPAGHGKIGAHHSHPHSFLIITLFCYHSPNCQVHKSLFSPTLPYGLESYHARSQGASWKGSGSFPRLSLFG
jgi:hypothetical protein